MAEYGITGWGAYVPTLRLERTAIAAAHAWMAPSLKAMSKGRRAYCSWDEDVVTMAVEAARNCLQSQKTDGIQSLQLASTTAPFADLLNSSIVATALRLPANIRTMDVSGSHRAGITALAAALQAKVNPSLVVASERPRAKPASVQEMQYGAGAAAFTLGDKDVVARLVGTSSSTALFVDHFRAAGASHDYYWEERWIRDEGYLKLGVQAIRKALADAGVSSDSVTHFIFPSPSKDAAVAVAKAAGVSPAAVADALDQDCGYTGAAHGPMMLANVLDNAKPGEVILIAGFGQGCDTLVLQTTDNIVNVRSGRSVSRMLAAGVSGQSYLRMAAAYDEISPDWGMRSERDGKTALTEQFRSAGQIYGFAAGKCGACGTVQFPQLAYCLECHKSGDGFEQVPLADEPAHMITYTADALTFHQNPPMFMGFVQFDLGARVLMEFVDVDPSTFDVGAPVRMTFRIHERDRQRGGNRYFWKASAAG